MMPPAQKVTKRFGPVKCARGTHRLLCASAIFLAAVACNRQDQSTQLPDGHLLRLVTAARQQGKSTAVASYFDEPRPGQSSLSGSLQLYSFVTATATPAQQIAITPDEILTWFVFDNATHVAGVRAESAECAALRLPATVEVKEGQLATPLRLGATNIQDIRVTMQSPDSRITLQSGRQYLLIGELCPQRVMRLAYGPSSIFYVDSQGQIKPVVTSGLNEAATSVVGLGTLERLRAVVASRREPNPSN